MEKVKLPNKFFGSKYVQVFICYSLASCVVYLSQMILSSNEQMETNAYMALHIIVPAVLWFFIGLVLSGLMLKQGDNLSVLRITIIIVALVLFEQITSAFLAQNIGFVKNNAVFRRWNFPNPAFPLWVAHLMIPLCVFLYRYACYYGKKRILAIPISLFTAMLISLYLNIVIYGGHYGFVTVKNYIDISIWHIYTQLVVYNALHCLFILLYRFHYRKISETKTEVPYSQKSGYFYYEAENIKMLISRMRKPVHRS